MYKLMSSWIFILIVSLFIVCSLSFAKEKKSRPSGWDKGEKRGWDSDVPPGLEGKRQGQKDKRGSLTDEERASKKEARKEKRREHKDKRGSLTDEERASKKEKRQERKISGAA